MNRRNAGAAPPRGIAPLDLFVEGLARGLIRYAAAHAPRSLSERLEEEWLADLTAHRGQLSRLRFSLGCCWAAIAIMHERGAAAAAGASTTGHKTLALYARHDSTFLSRRTIALLLIASLHLALIYALAVGLTISHGIQPAPSTPVRADFLKDPHPNNAPPPLPPPRLAPPQPVEYPPSDIPIDAPPADDALRATAPASQETRPPLSAAPVHHVVGGPGKGFPDTEDYYPAASIRMGETGAAAVRVCVDSRGRLTSDPTILQSSGSERIDEAARRLAKAGSGHYRASTDDGRPVDSCFPFRIAFRLRN